MNHCKEYCDYYKPILVEEILLVEHPSLLPNGKCSAIGMLARDEDKLLSLRIPELPESVQLEDGSFAIDISFSKYSGRIPQQGDHVEVCGALSLYDTQCSGEIDSTTTSGFLRRRLMETDNVAELYEEMRAKYKPFIEVELIKQVANARELLVCNLRMRGLQTQKT
ncbi:uncharacterized protein LOC118458527 [Anopheles albimanus]|uniref:uncharacterized protein LOC118458527 n=1 Tax=Anopheles albimanus TaxID=7167 RepID=UPI00163FBE45|nr:uncharacterized protein LOC118458527 [Anopheles albimanus]